MLLSPELYARTSADVHNLQSKLSGPAVISLAQEVLSRVAARSNTINLPGLRASVEEIEELSHALISAESDAGLQFIRDLRADGTAIDVLYLSYLAGAARRLGEWWETDRVSFIDVNIGTTRIYAIMRALGHGASVPVPAPRRLACFASVPGETHILGVSMATDLFREQGWEITLLTGLSHDDLVKQICGSGVRIVGLSSGGVHSSEALARLIVALHIQCPTARIVVSGHVVEEANEIVSVMGADSTATTVPEALDAFELIWREQTALDN